MGERPIVWFILGLSLLLFVGNAVLSVKLYGDMSVRMATLEYEQTDLEHEQADLSDRTASLINLADRTANLEHAEEVSRQKREVMMGPAGKCTV